MNPSAPFRRVNRWYWATLGGAILLWALSHAWRVSADSRTIRRANRWIAASSNAALPPLDAAGRREFITLLSDLQQLGDDRRLAALSPWILRQSWSAAEWSGILDVVTFSMRTWNDRLPAWRESVLGVYLRSGGASLPPGFPINPSMPDRTQVTLRFDAPLPKSSALFVAGNWDSAGRLALLSGWKPQSMRLEGLDAKGGRWSITLSLAPTRYGHRYHAVVRTAPWPQGKALGAASFTVPALPSTIQIAAIHDAPPLSPAVAPSPTPRVKVAVVGIDGASWHVILPLVQEGYLPNLSRMLQKGASARLISIPDHGGYYPSLPSIHTAITGVYAFRHQMGVDFLGLMSRKRIARLWAMASQFQKRVVVVCVWGTFPVEPVHGVMLSEAFFYLFAEHQPEIRRMFDDPFIARFASTMGVTISQISSLRRFTDLFRGCLRTVYPPERQIDFEKHLLSAKPGAASSLVEASSRYFDEMATQASLGVVQEHPTDLLMTYLIGMDAANHNDWLGFEPGVLDERYFRRYAQYQQGLDRMRSESRQRFLAVYRQLDDEIGRLAAQSEHLVLYSDHGMSVETVHPYLVVTISPSRILETYRHQPGALQAAQRIRFRLGTDFGAIFYAVDNVDLRQLSQFLDSVLLSESGERFFRTRFNQERGGQPELEVQISDAAGRASPFVPLVAGRQRVDIAQVAVMSTAVAGHAGDGLLVAYGPTVKAGPAAQDLYEVDVTPLVLYLLGLPLPQNINGQLPQEILAPAALAAHPPQWIPAYRKPPSTALGMVHSIDWELFGREIFAQWLQKIHKIRKI